MTNVKRTVGNALDFFIVWFLCNAIIYLIVMFTVLTTEVRLKGDASTLVEAASYSLVAVPELMVLMIIPSLVFIAISWMIRVKSSWRFRAFVFALLLLPCIWSGSMVQFLLKAGIQALFALLMIRSRTGE